MEPECKMFFLLRAETYYAGDNERRQREKYWLEE